MQHGIIVYRASRLEALLPPLLSVMDAAPPAWPLQPVDVIAAHPGIRQWLVRAIARERGAGGIAANLSVELPSTWFDRLARRVLGEAAVALRPYRREALRWRIHERLPTSTDASVLRYLRGPDASRRRFQLADRIAAIYSRYLVYRPDWLQAWMAGHDDVPAATFLAPLWRDVRAQIGMPHRGERLAALLRRLDAAPDEALGDEPLHVFGISHLAPTEFATLRAVARRRPVVLYVPDPCREYWAGLRPERDQLRELASLPAFAEESERRFLSVGHPLLASWGRLGQHFMLALAGADDVAVDIRHSEDERADAATHRLARLQDSIRQLDPYRVGPSDGAPEPVADRSLRVHACHTRLRELEVLRDALLREREERPGLRPSDIVVMAPDIQAYVALLPAVFGEAGRAQGVPLPYHLADVPLVQAHPLLLAFTHLLDLPQSRLSAAQVLDLLSVEEIARALGLDPAGVEVLSDWIARSRVAWALDPAFRERFGVPPIAEHTFAWGMDRLLAGYVLGSDDDGEAAALVLPGGEVIVPVEGVDGVQADVLGALDRLLQQLAQLCRDAARRMSLRAWSQRCEALVDGLFRAAFGDASAVDALNDLRRLVRSLQEDADDAGVDPEVGFDVVRDVLRERLLGLSERQRFLVGGMTVCGMVPQRAIPFRVVAVLGLDDGAFPRAGSDAGLDLMATHRRLGDRDVRSDDRYLFLETVMAARDVLHLSYIGEGVRDGRPRMPAAPLAELLALLDETHGLRGAADDVPRPWFVRHPLQPFDARYFDGSDPRLFSYRDDLLALLREQGKTPPAFFDRPLPDADLAPGVVSLAHVLDYFRRPAQFLLRRCGVRLDALDPDRLADSEPLDPQFARIDRVAQRLFFDTAARGEAAVPPSPPDWLRHGGLWPPGRAGDAAWEAQRETVDELLDEAWDSALFRDGMPQRLPLTIDLAVDGLRLQGELSRAWRAVDGDWLFDLAPGKKREFDFGRRISLFLEWALLQLALPEARARVRVLLPGAAGDAGWLASLDDWNEALRRADSEAPARAAARRADLTRRVGALLALYVRAQAAPLWYFPKTSWAAAASGGDPERIGEAWIGGEHHLGEQAYTPGYERLFAGGCSLTPDTPAFAELVAVARELSALITLDAEPEHD